MDMPRTVARPLRGSLLRRSSRIFEVGLLSLGFSAAAVYGASVALSSLYQTYASRQFDLAIHQKNPAAAALSGFFPIPAIGSSTLADGPGEAAGNAREWSFSRLRAYSRLLGSPAPAALARLQIPSVGLSVMVLEGTDPVTLNRGVGHIEGTALPGEPGNTGLAGHRDSFFRCLDRLSARDVILLTTAEGRTVRYAVDHIEIVQPEHLDVLQATSSQTLTLVTCYPFHFIGPAPLRYIVKATRLDS